MTGNWVEKPWVADQAVLKSKELTSQTLPCLTLTDFHEVSRAAGPKRHLPNPVKEGSPTIHPRTILKQTFLFLKCQFCGADPMTCQSAIIRSAFISPVALNVTLPLRS